MNLAPLRRTIAVLSVALLAFNSSAEPAPPAPTTAPTKGLYVAVGYGGRRISSPDARTWENDTQWSDKAADNDDVLFNVAFGKGKFVAVGGGAKVGHILVTRDGKEWREMPQQKGRVATVAFGNDRFVAGHSNDFLFSDDGEAWKQGVKLDLKGSVHLRKSAFGAVNGDGVFVAIGDWDPPGQKRIWFRAATADGEKVTALDPGTHEGRAIAFGAGRFVVVGPDGLIESSPDGKAWERQKDEAKGEELNTVAWSGDHFLAAGHAAAYTSPDGVHWKKEAKGIPCGILYAGNGTWIGGSWGGNLWRSADGLAWKKYNNVPQGNSFEAMAFGTP